VVGVIAQDVDRAWLLTADAGEPIATYGNDPAIWLRALPRYAELQRGEVAHMTEHFDHGVPDRRTETLPAQYEELLRSALPIDPLELDRLRGFSRRFAELCEELAAAHPVASIQHDDLHMRSLFVDGAAVRVLDWGDACVADPFGTLVVTFKWIEELNGLAPEDPMFRRLRDAYLEPWGGDVRSTFELAMRVALVAQAVGWQRQRAAMPSDYRASFDPQFAALLRRVLARSVESGSGC